MDLNRIYRFYNNYLRNHILKITSFVLTPKS